MNPSDPENSVVAVAISASDQLRAELADLKKNWWALLLSGLVLVVGGLASIGFPLLTSLSLTIGLGVITMVCGGVTVIAAFFAGRWGQFFLQLFYGVLYLVLGGVMVFSPAASNVAATFLIASFAILGGFFRIIAGAAIQFPQWGWAVVGGFIGILFGFYVLAQMPEVSLWLIGLLVGIDLLITGISWMLLSFDVRKIPVSDKPS